MPEISLFDELTHALGPEAVRRDDEKFIDTYRRVGNAPFKEKLYATH